METTPTTPVTVAATDIYDGAPSSLAHGRYARCLHREAETWVAPVPATDIARWRELQSGHDWPGAMWVARHAPQDVVVDEVGYTPEMLAAENRKQDGVRHRRLY